MSYFQRHLRNSQITQSRTPQQLQPYPLRSKKYPNKQKDLSFQDPKRPKHNENTTHCEPTQRKYPEPRQSVKMPARFATQAGYTESPEEPMKAIFVEADNSMEEMLNSSLNHFQNFLKSQDRIEEHHQLLEQNQILRFALEELRAILRDKLDKALRKQESELKGVMTDYLQLISKLLADKEELTTCVEHLEEQLTQANHNNQSLTLKLQQYQQREEKINQMQVDLQSRIEEIQNSRLSVEDSSLADKVAAQNTKIHTLYKCLQRGQTQKKILQDSLIKLQRADDRYRHLEDDYMAKLTEMEKEHEEEFMEFQKAVRETIAEKDQKIERLSRIVENRSAERELIYS